MTNIETFNLAIQKIKDDGDNVNIILHYMPDPDSMATAFALQEYLKSCQIDNEMFYTGEISHPQNKTMQISLALSLTKIGDSSLQGKNICVDCTPKNSGIDTAFMIIDHHSNSVKNCEYVINEPKYGACSTIMWEILNSLGIEWDLHEDIATALLLGIRTDTKDLLSESMIAEDFKAYESLIHHMNKEKVQRIMNYPVPRYVFEKRNLLKDKNNFMEKNGIFVGGVGYIPRSQRDVIAILAEDYLRMETVSTTVIFCITDNDTLEVSIRTINTTVDVKDLMQNIFGDFGGGKIEKGGAKVPLNVWSNMVTDSLKNKFWEITCEQLFRLILKEDYETENKGE